MGYLDNNGLLYFWQKIKTYIANHPGPKGDKGDTGNDGPQGDPGVYVGSTAPTDENVRVWVDTSGTGVSLVDIVYPVGSIYMSVNSVSPATLFGGTWTRIQDVFLLAAGSTYVAGTTGGEATHTLTVDEIPSHKHSLSFGGANVSGGTWNLTDHQQNAYTGENFYRDGGYMQNTGGGLAHNNMPPYLAVYIWKRTA